MVTDDRIYQVGRRFLTGVVLTAIAGLLGGAILAGRPLQACGSAAGAFFALPLGIVFAALSSRRPWPAWFLPVAQFFGAVVLGLLNLDAIHRDAALQWPLLGQFIGGTLGYVLARRIMPAHDPVPGRCRTCGYNLHGLNLPRCPECGTGYEEHKP